MAVLISFFVEWHINLWGLFNAKAILVEEQLWYYLTHSLKDKKAHTFYKSISLKVNIIARLEFEFLFYGIAIQHVRHYIAAIDRFIN